LVPLLVFSLFRSEWLDDTLPLQWDDDEVMEPILRNLKLLFDSKEPKRVLGNFRLRKFNFCKLNLIYLPNSTAFFTSVDLRTYG